MAFDGLAGQVYAPPPVVVPLPSAAPLARTKPHQAQASTGGGVAWRPTYMAWAPEFEITEHGLEQLVHRIVAFSESPELRTWTSSVLSIAGRKGIDLSTEKALAKALLETVQQTDFPLYDPTARALYLAAGLVAIGLPTAVVAHGELEFTRALAAVKADGRWWYADPNGPHAFGHHAPFLLEKLFRIPEGPKPPPDELSEYKKQVEEQQRQILELETRLGVLEEQLQTLRAAPALVAAPTKNNERLFKYVAVGALGLLAVTLFALYRVSRVEPAPRRRTRPKRRSNAGRGSKRTPGSRRRRGG
jgi:hypothetical protein